MSQVLHLPSIDTSVPSISRSRALHLRVAEWLHKRNFDIAAPTGIALSEPPSPKAIGLLQPIDRQETMLFGLLPLPQRRKFIGILWLSCVHRGAGANRWIFECFGREHLEFVRCEARAMSGEFDVNVIPILADETTRLERWFGDHFLM